MEKFSQFRDKGSGVSPFIPIKPSLTTISAITRSFVFLLRLVPFIIYIAIYFLVLHKLPLPTAVRKLLLWGVVAIAGIWWVDLQIDGVKRGHLSQHPSSRVPQPGSVIASSFTSPIDALYLAAVFDPIFTISYPQSGKVSRVSLFQAMTQALNPAQLTLSPRAGATELNILISENPGRVFVVFPECGTTNGKGILPFSPSLISVPVTVKIFPISIRYAPADITTPIPGAWATFIWNLLGKPTHCVHVRIAESISSTSGRDSTKYPIGLGHNGRRVDKDQYNNYLTPEERLVLDRVSEALARLARNVRVGLSIKDKAAFLEAWTRPRKSRETK